MTNVNLSAVAETFMNVCWII